MAGADALPTPARLAALALSAALLLYALHVASSPLPRLPRLPGAARAEGVREAAERARRPLRDDTAPATTSLTFVTLLFGGAVAKDNLTAAHNCRLIAEHGAPHRFVVYTDALHLPLCGLCRCERFVPSGCRCGVQDAGGKCNLCEKLYFLVDVALPAHRELVYLDSDLVVLHPVFLHRLWWRAQAHDFLAMHAQAKLGVSHWSELNTGLFFMRRLPHLNYSEMKDIMVRRKYTDDQRTISDFVHERYDNWDSLSLRWHCRVLARYNLDIPPDQCYTVHDRFERDDVLRALNMSLLTV